MSSPPPGYYDVVEGNKVVDGLNAYAYFNRAAIDPAFGLQGLLLTSLGQENESKINLLTFNFHEREQTDRGFDYTRFDEPGVTLVATKGITVALQGAQSEILFGNALQVVDALVGTDNADTFIFMDKAPEIIDLGNGDDLLFINHTPTDPNGVFRGQSLVLLDGGNDTFISNDVVADLILATQGVWETSERDTVIASKGSLVIKDNNDTVLSATGDQNDIKEMTLKEFGAAFIADPLQFLFDHSTLSPMGGSEAQIDAGQLLALAQQALKTMHVQIASEWTVQPDGTLTGDIVGTYSATGDIIYINSDFAKLMQAFDLAQKAPVNDAGQVDIGAFMPIMQELGFETYEQSYTLLRAMVGFHDQSKGFNLPVPLPATPVPDVVETTLIPMGYCTFYAAYEQYDAPDEVQTVGQQPYLSHFEM